MNCSIYLSILPQLNWLQQNNLYTDVLLYATLPASESTEENINDYGSIRCHRVVLAAASPYLHRMIADGKYLLEMFKFKHISGN